MRRVICIGAGQLSTKKANNRINRRNQYLNYGLLSLASVLRRSGLTPVVIHGHFSSPTETLETARSCGLAESDLPILLSVPSFYAVAWARAFILEAKALSPSRKVIVGGRWVVGNQPELLKAMLPDLDWLDRHRECIYGVSVSPVIVFGWPNEADAYLNSLAQYGATRDHSPCAGVTHIKLSKHVNFEDSLELARMISRRFMSADRYYALKSFSYFPRDYRFKDFLADMVHEADSHSFSTECLGGCPKEVMGLSSHASHTDPMDCQVS